MITSRIFDTSLIREQYFGVKFNAEFKYVMFPSVGTLLVWLIYYFWYLNKKSPYGVSESKGQVIFVNEMFYF